MRFSRFAAVFSFFAVAIGSAAFSAPGGGDLLVAPTRVVLDGGRGTEVILNNIGAAPATYRVSLELRRMMADGGFEEITTANANEQEQKALSMISYAPRRVVLAPNQPQSIRIGLRPPVGLPDGEYRAHMLFRAIPESKPVAAAADPKGVSISLTPIYGVTIPIIVRRGTLKATAALADVKIIKDDGKPALSLAISRSGTRSTYGRIRVLQAGSSQPVFEVRGVAVYPELKQRTVRLILPPEVAAKLAGEQATVQYMEDAGAGGGVIAELKTVIR
jgi:P pilus assembly chaperone PapD